MIEGSHTRTFAAMAAEARRLAAAFRASGLKPGEVVSFQLPNWYEAMVVNLAAAMCGLVCNPIVPIYRDAEVRFILRDCKAKMLFVPDGVIFVMRLTSRSATYRFPWLSNASPDGETTPVANVVVTPEGEIRLIVS